MKSFLRERAAHSLQEVIFYGLLVLIILTAIPYGTVDAQWVALFETAVFGFTILWIVEGSLTGSFLVRGHRLLLPLFALVIFACIQSLTLWQSAGGPAMAGVPVNRALSVDPFETWRFALKLLAITLTLGMLLRYTSSAERLRVMVYVVIGVALASAVFGLLRPEILSRQLGFARTRLGTESSFAQFENRNHFAFLMEMAIGMVLGLVALSRASAKRLLVFLVLGAVFWLALFLTHSRGGVVSLLVEVPCFFLVYRAYATRAGTPATNRGKMRSGKLATTAGVICFLIAIVAASVVVIGGDATIHSLESTPSEFRAPSFGPPKVLRPEIWRATLKLVRDYPLTGVGFAGYSVAIPRHLNSSGESTPQQAHNDYLEVLASGGAVGSLLCSWFAVLLVRTTRESVATDTPDSVALKSGAIAGLFAVAVHSFFDFGLHITVNALVCCTLIVIAVKSNGSRCRAAASVR